MKRLQKLFQKSLPKAMSKAVHFGRDQSGATAIEYGLLFLLISIAIISALATITDSTPSQLLMDFKIDSRSIIGFLAGIAACGLAVGIASMFRKEDGTSKEVPITGQTKKNRHSVLEVILCVFLALIIGAAAFTLANLGLLGSSIIGLVAFGLGMAISYFGKATDTSRPKIQNGKDASRAKSDETTLLSFEEQPLLSVQDLSVAFTQGGKTTTAVDRISFDIAKGETVALVGESGSGKSVSALSVMKLLPYPPASHPSGKILFKGEDLLDSDEADLRRVRGDDITMIFQEPMTSLNPLHTIERQIGEILEIHHGVSSEAARKRTIDLLNQVGIRDPEKRLNAYPHQMSGGQRQRVMIAMALANEPQLLIADEPTTALDVTVQAQILELLTKLKVERGLSMLFITHDLGIVRKFADRVCVMTKGNIVEHGPTAEIFDNPQHEYTKHLLAAEPTGEPPALKKDAKTVLVGDDVKVWFPIKAGFLRKTVDHVKAVDGIDLQLKAGQTLGVVGESGSGKTTLGLALTRMISSKGEITFNEKAIHDYSFNEMKPLRREMQIVFQDPYGSLSPRMSVAEIVAEGLELHRPNLSASEVDDMVADVLGEVGLEPATRHRYPHEFSGGQRQRIAIARAMILEPKFVMLDEPTSALDMSVQAQVVELLLRLQEERNLAYLFISHDLKVVRALANDVIVMRLGKIVEHGPAEQIFDAPKEDYTKALMAAAFDLETAPAGIVSQ